MKKEIKFKTRGELAAYLMNKGPLRTGTKHIYYDPDNYPNDPFRFKAPDGESKPIMNSWDVGGRAYYAKAPWYECIPDGKYVACYVSDVDNVPGPGNASGVVRYSEEDGCYMSITGQDWEYATPIPADKLWVPDE